MANCPVTLSISSSFCSLNDDCPLSASNSVTRAERVARASEDRTISVARAVLAALSSGDNKALAMDCMFARSRQTNMKRKMFIHMLI